MLPVGGINDVDDNNVSSALPPQKKSLNGNW